MNALENRFIWDPSTEQLPVYFVGNNYAQDAMRDTLLSPGLPFQRFLFHGILSHALQESFGLPDFHRSSDGAAARSCSLAGDLLAKRECCLARAAQSGPPQAGRLACACGPRMVATRRQFRWLGYLQQDPFAFWTGAPRYPPPRKRNRQSEPTRGRIPS